MKVRTKRSLRGVDRLTVGSNASLRRGVAAFKVSLRPLETLYRSEWGSPFVALVIGCASES